MNANPFRPSAVFALLVAPIAACSSQSRSVDYYVANQETMRSVLASCATGATQGSDCENAKIADAKIEGDKTFSDAIKTSQPAHSAKARF